MVMLLLDCPPFFIIKLLIATYDLSWTLTVTQSPPSPAAIFRAQPFFQTPGAMQYTVKLSRKVLRHWVVPLASGPRSPCMRP